MNVNYYLSAVKGFYEAYSHNPHIYVGDKYKYGQVHRQFNFLLQFSFYILVDEFRYQLSGNFRQKKVKCRNWGYKLNFKEKSNHSDILPLWISTYPLFFRGLIKRPRTSRMGKRRQHLQMEMQIMDVKKSSTHTTLVCFFNFHFIFLCVCTFHVVEA